MSLFKENSECHFYLEAKLHMGDVATPTLEKYRQFWRADASNTVYGLPTHRRNKLYGTIIAQ